MFSHQTYLRIALVTGSDLNVRWLDMFPVITARQVHTLSSTPARALFSVRSPLLQIVLHFIYFFYFFISIDCIKL